MGESRCLRLPPGRAFPPSPPPPSPLTVRPSHKAPGAALPGRASPSPPRGTPRRRLSSRGPGVLALTPANAPVPSCGRHATSAWSPLVQDVPLLPALAPVGPTLRGGPHLGGMPSLAMCGHSHLGGTPALFGTAVKAAPAAGALFGMVQNATLLPLPVLAAIFQKPRKATSAVSAFFETPQNIPWANSVPPEPPQNGRLAGRAVFETVQNVSWAGKGRGPRQVVHSGGSGGAPETAGNGRDAPTTMAPPENDRSDSTGGAQQEQQPQHKEQNLPSPDTPFPNTGPPDKPPPDSPPPDKPPPDKPPPDKPPPDRPSLAQFQSFSAKDLLGPEKVDPDDVKLFRDRLCGYQTFFVTGQEPFGEAGEGVLLLGNMRGIKEEVYSKLRVGMALYFGDKYELFLVEEPQRGDADPMRRGSGEGGKGGDVRVSLVLVRREAAYAPSIPAWHYVLSLLLLGITAGACLELGLATQISKVPPEVIKYFTAPNPEGEPPTLETLAPFVRDALPVAYGVLGIQAFHELGHVLLAARRKVKLGVPFLIPNITIGTFGSILQFRGPCPDRTAKFDVALAGPVAGGALSLAMFVAGLVLTAAVTSDPGASQAWAGDLGPGIRGLLADELVKVPSLLFQGSLLLGSLSHSVLGNDAFKAATVAIHPLVITGWCGLTVSALNLLPAGTLDGGRAMQAAFGRTPAVWTSSITYILLGLGLIGGTLSLPFGLYVLLVQRNLEKPSLNDVTEVSGWRKVLIGCLLGLSLLVLLPYFEGFAESVIGMDSVGMV